MVQQRELVTSLRETPEIIDALKAAHNNVLGLKCNDRMFVLPSSDNYQPSINQVPRLNSPLCVDSLAIQIKTSHCY
jgi:hypothetical protein